MLDTMDYDFDDDDEEEIEDDEREDTLQSLEAESSYICNSCGEEIVIPVDHSEGQRQEYVEDCPVCCNPNVIYVEVDLDGQPHIWSRSEQDPN